MKGSSRHKVKQWRVETLRAMSHDPEHPYHGSVSGYSIGCACDKCRSMDVYKKLDDGDTYCKGTGEIVTVEQLCTYDDRLERLAYEKEGIR